MNRLSTLLVALPCYLISAYAVAFESRQLVGTWCFYEQEAAGNRVDERVTITFDANGRYRWVDTYWKQDGSWSIDGTRLVMTDVGRHRLVSVGRNHVEMKRFSTMRMRRGACRDS